MTTTRSGSFWERAHRRARTLLRPDVAVLAAPGGMNVEWNVPVTVRDGTVLRVNVFRPPGDAPVPVIMSAHPYGKDNIPAKTRSGRGVNFQYRLFPQPRQIAFCAWTSWEAPDPAVWLRRGFAVVNCDLRGGGTSQGIGALLSDDEARDYYELIEWAGTQPWCNGRVGLDGVSYLAISQYKVAALRPPHLAAICPWEGFTDLYRDFARPGGSREDGFLTIWSGMTSHLARVSGDLRREVVARPQRDAWYEALAPQLERIEVPMLVCASFSDHSLHSRGSFEAFRRAGAAQKWLYTHRGGKWCGYYGADATQARIAFFERFLKDKPPASSDALPVRLAVYEEGSEPVAVTAEPSFPPPGLHRRELFLDCTRRALVERAPEIDDATASFATRGAPVCFDWEIPEDLDAIGPMALRVYVSIAGGGDALLFAGARKFRRDGREAYFEGSYGFGYDMPSKGWQRLAHRELDARLSTPLQPVHVHTDVQPLAPGEIVPVEIALLPHATRLRAGERLRLELRGTWHFARDPLRGQFPAWYAPSARARITVHGGARYPSRLLLETRFLSGV